MVQLIGLKSILKRRAMSVFFFVSCYAGTNSYKYLWRKIFVFLSVSVYLGVILKTISEIDPQDAFRYWVSYFLTKKKN